MGFSFRAFIFYVVECEGHHQATVRHSLTKAKTTMPHFIYKFKLFLTNSRGLADYSPTLKQWGLVSKIDKI